MKRLNYHHLYYFWQVAKQGKLTQVAEQLHISQSALSAQIKQLEQQCEVELFQRTGRKLILTTTGKRVLEYAQQIFEKGQELEQLLSEHNEDQQTRLSIGVLTNLSRNFVESFIAPLLNQTKVRFSLETATLEILLQGLVTQQFDLVLTNCTVSEHQHEASWQQQLVARQPLAIVGPSGIEAGQSFPADYQNVQWVLPGKSSAIRAAFEFYCAKLGFQPNIKAEVDDMAMLRLLARDTQALSVLPPVVVKDEVAAGSLIVHHYIPQAHEDFYAISVNRRAFPKVLTHLLDNQITATENIE